MSSGIKLIVPGALALYLAAACTPDLDSLSAGYSPNGGNGSSGSGAAAGGMGNAGNAGNTGGSPGVDTCENHKKDANESDVDCGGSSICKRCATDLHCTLNSDCELEFCKNKICTAPTCTDKVRNQDETGVDCGGTCKPCELGVSCSSKDDCTTEYCADPDGAVCSGCDNGVCSDHCKSGVAESDETDKDCGGSCPPCGDARRCNEGADCVSKVCSNKVCLAATCSDAIKNQDESDKDCGGACAAMAKACGIGRICNGPADCESWVCTEGKCTADLITVAPNAIIDDYEDGNFSLPAKEARVGAWYQFGDGTSSATYSVVTIKRGASIKGLETKGKDFTSWGSGVGVDFAPAKAPYDPSAHTEDKMLYDGITFWARAENNLSVTVAFPDEDTDPGGGKCTTAGPPAGMCDHHYTSFVAVTPNWQRFTIYFKTDLTLEAGTIPTPMGFKPNAMISVQFRMQAGASYDLFIDDLAFVKCPDRVNHPEQCWVQ